MKLVGTFEKFLGKYDLVKDTMVGVNGKIPYSSKLSVKLDLQWIIQNDIIILKKIKFVSMKRRNDKTNDQGVHKSGCFCV